MARWTKEELTYGLTNKETKTAVKIANNTIAYNSGETIVYRHFNTNILRFDPDGTITFNTDGHETTTTKQRLNTMQDKVNIWSESFVWYADVRGSLSTKDKVKFVDGMTYHPDRGFEFPKE
jgi:hypothetical protein